MAKKPAEKAQKGKATGKDIGGSKRVGIVELVNNIYATSSDITKKKVDEIVRSTIAEIHHLLAYKKSVAFNGTFVLEPVHRPERIGRNPQKPSEQVKIPSHWSVKLKLGSILKTDLNLE